MAGNAYEILCTATVSEGIQSTPHLYWENYNTTSGGDISVGSAISDALDTTLPLEFSVLRVSDTGTYTCHAILYSVALDSPVEVTASTSLNVEGTFHHGS